MIAAQPARYRRAGFFLGEVEHGRGHIGRKHHAARPSSLGREERLVADTGPQIEYPTADCHPRQVEHQLSHGAKGLTPGGRPTQPTARHIWR